MTGEVRDRAWLLDLARQVGLGLLTSLVALRWLQAALVAATGLALGDHGYVAAAAIGSGGVLVRGLHGGLRVAAAERAQAACLNKAMCEVARASALSEATSDPATLELRVFRVLTASRDLLTDVYPGLLANLLVVVTLAPLAISRVPSHLLPWLAVGSLGAVAAYAVAGPAQRRALREAYREDSVVFREVAVLLQAHLEVVASGAAPERVKTIAQHAGRWTAAVRRAALLAALGGQVPAAALIVAGALAWLSLDTSDGGLRSLADLVVVGSVFPSIVALAQGVTKERADRADVAALVTLLDVPADPAWQSNLVARADPHAVIDFKNVTFTYADGAPAVTNLTFRWEPREALALAGPNGSGKSTALRILLRLGDPSEGDVLIGDASLRTLDPGAWRRLIAFSPQRAWLPSDGTVGALLRADLPAIRDDVLLAWLERLGLAGSLRMHFGDPFGAPVEALSSGQRQRLALLRAFASARPIVVLDEPEANLDAEGIRLLVGLIMESRGTRRLLIAAHDPAILAAADRVVTLGSSAMNEVATVRA